MLIVLPGLVGSARRLVVSGEASRKRLFGARVSKGSHDDEEGLGYMTGWREPDMRDFVVDNGGGIE
jgi:hypothetical protein